MPDLRVSLGPLTLPNPVLVAAGTFGYGVEFADALPLEALGGLITKTLTLTPRDGHPPPRLVETPAGMLNAVGLANIGLDAFLREKLPALETVRAPLIVSVLGDSTEELAELVGRLDAVGRVDAIEINLSCPNLKRSSELGVGGSELTTGHPLTPNSQLSTGRMIAHDAEATLAMVQAARRLTRKPLIAKLSPDVTDLTPIAQAAERAGADAVSLGNTFTGMSIDPETRRSRLGTTTGGLSGPAIRPLAVYRVWYTARSIRLPVIGVGGIAHAEDAVEFLIAGATAVAIGTANFANPRAPLRVIQGLTRYLRRHGLASPQQLRGIVS